MNIQSTQITTNRFKTPPTASQSDSQTFGLNFDPFGGVKRVIGDTVELGVTFGMGALPGYGMKHHGEIAIMGGFNGRGNSDSKLAVGGAALNAAGTLGLLVAAGQYALGGDPGLALGISATALAGSGVISAALMR